MKKEEILRILREVQGLHGDVRIGLAGSYVNGTESPGSDIDIVLDGDSMRMDIAENIRSLFKIPVDILWMDLLREEDIRLDKLAMEIGIGENEDSVYKTIKREVVWV